MTNAFIEECRKKAKEKEGERGGDYVTWKDLDGGAMALVDLTDHKIVKHQHKSPSGQVWAFDNLEIRAIKVYDEHNNVTKSWNYYEWNKNHPESPKMVRFPANKYLLEQIELNEGKPIMMFYNHSKGPDKSDPHYFNVDFYGMDSDAAASLYE